MTGVSFGPWQPIEEAQNVAPEAAGVLQARAETLRAYPKGKSAMVLYDHSLTLRAHVSRAATLRSALAAGGRWIRFGETTEPARECQRLLDRFVERFGTAPVANGMETHG